MQSGTRGRAGNEVSVVGFDANDDALQAIQNGTMLASVAQNPSRIGELGVEKGGCYRRRESVENEIPVEVELVTKANVSQFMSGGGTSGG